MSRARAFDCVAMKDSIQAKLLRRQQAMSEQERRDDMRGTLATSGSPVARMWRKMTCGRPAVDYGPSVGGTKVIAEHDRVVLKQDLLQHGLQAGDMGTVVHVYRDGRACEVEFVALDGETVAVVTVEAGGLRPVSRHEIAHVRHRVNGACE